MSESQEGAGEDCARKSESSVQEKIHCVFESVVVEEPSSKRNYQPYKIVAIDKVRQAALECNITEAQPTEKFDGTCVFIQTYRDIPWLWARHDRKPTKAADKKFKRFQTEQRAWQVSGGECEPKPVFNWDMGNDFKDTPVDWLPASGAQVNEKGEILPDEGGHVFGWVPIDPRGRSHMWHASAVDLEAGVGLVLNLINPDTNQLEISLVPLTEFIGCTMELIGTNVNANPYKLGSKKAPLHLLVKHGSIPTEKVPLDHQSFSEWFQSPQGQVEGVVWHCSHGNMFKLHRHHLQQKWPVEGLPTVMSLPVGVSIEKERFDLEPDSSLYKFIKFHGREFPSLKDFSDAFIAVSD